MTTSQSPEVLQFSKEELATAARRSGAEGVKTLIETVSEGSERRTLILERAKLALQMLKGDFVTELEEDARQEVAEGIVLASQEMIDGGEQAVETIVGKQANETLKIFDVQLSALSGEVAEWESIKADALVIEKELAGLAGDIAIAGREFMSDDLKTKSMQVGGAVVAMGITGMLLSKIWGTSENPGKLRKWVIACGSMGAAIAAFLGINGLTRKKPSGAIATALGVPTGVGKNVIDKGGKAADVVVESVKGIAGVTERLMNGDIEGAVDELLDHGGAVAAKGTKLVFELGTETFIVPAQFAHKVYEYTQGRATMGEVAILYGEAGVAYFLGMGTIRALVHGRVRIPSIKVSAARIAFWPVSMGRDTMITAWRLSSPEGRGILKLPLQQWGPIPSIRNYVIKQHIATGRTDDIARGVKRVAELMKQYNVMKNNPEGVWTGATFTETQTKGVLTQARKISSEIDRAFQNGSYVLPDDAPDWLQRIHTQAGGDAEAYANILSREAKNIKIATGSAEVAEQIDELAELVAKGASVDDIRKAGGNASQCIMAGHDFDEATRGLSYTDNFDEICEAARLLPNDAQRARALGMILDTGTEDTYRLIGHGFGMDDILQGIAGNTNQPTRLAHYRNLLENGTAATDMLQGRHAVTTATICEAMGDIPEAGTRQRILAEILNHNPMAETDLRAFAQMNLFEEADLDKALKIANNMPSAPKPPPPPLVPKGVINATGDTIAGIDDIAGLSAKLDDVFKNHAECAIACIKHLNTIDDPAKRLAALHALEQAAHGFDDPAFFAEMCSSQRRAAFMVAKAERYGVGAVKHFSKTARILRAARPMLEVGGAGFDAFTIYVSISEMIETQDLLNKLANKPGKEELRKKVAERYYYLSAELGTGVVGLGAFGTSMAAGLGIVGAGAGTVAAPIALATLPASAAIYAARQGHMREEGMLKDAQDWLSEHDRATLLHDTQHYDWSEWAGDGWNTHLDDWRWLMYANPITAMAKNISIASSLFVENSEEVEQMRKDIKNMEETKIEAVVTAMTPPSENAEARQNIIDYKTEYIVQFAKSETFIGMRHTSDVAKMFQDAEYFALMRIEEENIAELEAKEDRTDQEERNLAQYKARQARLDSLAQGSDDVNKRAEAYEMLLREDDMETLYWQYYIKVGGLNAEDRPRFIPQYKREIELAIGNQLVQKCEPIVLRSELDMEETFWTDAAKKQLQVSMRKRMHPILKDHSVSIGRNMIAYIDESYEKQQAHSIHFGPIQALIDQVDDAYEAIEDLYAMSAEKLYDSIPEEERELLENASEFERGVYYSKIDSVGASKGNAVPIEQIAQQGEQVEAEGNHFYVSNSKGYKLVPIRNGQLAGASALREIVMSIDTDEPFKVPKGTYAVYPPGREIPRTTLWGEQPLVGWTTIEVQNEMSEVEQKRMSDGIEALKEAGAIEQESNKEGTLFSMRRSTLDNPVTFYFDHQGTREWIVNVMKDWRGAQWKYDAYAIAGKEAGTFGHVSGMAWFGSGDKYYNAVIDELAAINDRPDTRGRPRPAPPRSSEPRNRPAGPVANAEGPEVATAA